MVQISWGIHYKVCFLALPKLCTPITLLLCCDHIKDLSVHEFHMMSSQQQQSVGNKINLKMDDSLESNLFTKCRQCPATKSLQKQIHI